MTSADYFHHVGNYESHSADILAEYDLTGERSTAAWRDCRYRNLPGKMRLLCDRATIDSNFGKLLQLNTWVVCERHHNILDSSGKVKNHFGPHVDSEGPASGPCHSLLYYYKIDPGVEDGHLNFYPSEHSDEPIYKFEPVSGDIVSFKDGIYHCPGNLRPKALLPWFGE